MREINGKTRVCGLMANPVEHTLSPVLHNNLAQKTGINLVYVPFKPEQEGLDAAVSGAFALNIMGLNVSVPYKQAVMDSLADIDQSAREIGAVNTLVRMEGGYKGYNTDYLGLKKALESDGISLKGKTAVILGAGGAAKSAAYLCCKEGAAKLYLLNRTLVKAEALAEELGRCFEHASITAMRTEDYKRIPEDSLTAIQTTSVGMYPHTGQAVIEDEAFYHKLETAYDVVYTPFETQFMKYAAKAGAKACNGLKMLLYQGITAFELWNHMEVDQETAEILYECMKKELKKP